MAQKMKTYDEMSTTKDHPWVPQESQDYVLRLTLGERNKQFSVMLLGCFANI